MHRLKYFITKHYEILIINRIMTRLPDYIISYIGNGGIHKPYLDGNKKCRYISDKLVNEFENFKYRQGPDETDVVILTQFMVAECIMHGFCLCL